MRGITWLVGGWCWLGLCAVGWTQSSVSEFAQAQQAAENQEYSSARHHCAAILRESPQHWDAHLLLTYAYAWEEEYEAAEQHLTQMMKLMVPMDSVDRSVLQEAMRCETRLAYWQGNTAEVARRADRGTALFPDDLEFGLLKGKAALADKEYEAALAAFDQVLAQDPDHEEAQRLRDEAYWHTAQYQAGVLYGHEMYSHSSFPRNTVSAELTRFWPQLTLTGRGSRSYRFDLVSHQLALEAWKPLSERWYLYAQLGGSDGRLFPRFRAALEPFCKVTSSVEVSAGFRYLNYTRRDAWIYTASATKYFGRGSLMARTFWSPTSAGWRKSFEIGGRWHLPDEYNFVELRVGSGASPDNAYLDATYQDLITSRSLYTVVGAQRRFRYRLLGRVWGVFDRQMPEPGTHFSIISLNAGLWKRF